ncbi:response regulator [Candidatus Uhrbacteria bacterium]|nr:response regulator [Candidatus Uhrbacteria bacterium]
MSSSKKLLIIDDDEFLLDIYKHKLTKEGFEVDIAKNSEEAFALIKKSKPDLIILDLIMPGMSGFDVLEELNATSGLSKIPVIVLTNLGQEEDRKRCFELGVKDYFVKTATSLEEVIKKIKEVI